MLRVTIVSPEDILYKGEAQGITVPGKKGQFEVLPHHAPIVSSLSPGIIQCKNQESTSIKIKWGLIDVAQDEVFICVEV